MDYYDAHVHFLWPGRLEQAARGWTSLREDGLRGMAVIIMGYHLVDRRRCLDLIPSAYHEHVDPALFDEPADPAECVRTDLQGIPLFPYLDSRYIEDALTDLRPFQQAGFRGLKILYIPEEDPENGMVGWKNLFGRSMRESEELTARLAAQAAAFRWPVIFHADLRRYGSFVEDLLKAHPGVPFVIPHFGFSRKAMAGLMDGLDHVYTDFSSLLPFMRQAPGAYAGFIQAHPDRVLFGSDATLGWAELSGRYLAFMKRLIPDRDVLRKVLSENYLCIHGDSDHA
ncbi:MAG: amidohydrolase [Deltaproteobacteria bacterium]|nr:amidohydrolase [Deltaproteobacteria bacterium]